jgi:hypothetical protein
MDISAFATRLLARYAANRSLAGITAQIREEPAPFRGWWYQNSDSYPLFGKGRSTCRSGCQLVLWQLEVTLSQAEVADG